MVAKRSKYSRSWRWNLKRADLLRRLGDGRHDSVAQIGHRPDRRIAFGKPWNASRRIRIGARPGRLQTCARVPGRCLVLRDERFPSGAGKANRSRTARLSPQRATAKGWKAKIRPQEHEWAERQAVGGECASEHEARKLLTAVCRAPRHEPKEQALTQGDPWAERSEEVSRGRSREDTG